MSKLVLLRHGESKWNKENRFSGWTDIDLTHNGIEEAKEAGSLLKKAGLDFDVAYTSQLKRAIHTLDYVLEAMDHKDLPVRKSWKLNERHYGALQGLNKAETVEKYGYKQVLLWRRSYDVIPPLLSKDDERAEEGKPLGESLKMVIERVVPYWQQYVVPEIQAGKRVLIVAHGNSLRGLVMHLDKLSEEEVLQLNIPTGKPLVFELNKNLGPNKHYYLDDIIISD